MKKLVSLILAVALMMSLCSAVSLADGEEPITLHVYFADPMMSEEETNAVEEALSDYTEETLGFRIDIVQFGGWSTYYEKMPLLIASDEEMDICWDEMGSFVSRSRAGAYLPLNELLPNHPELVDTIYQELWDGCTIDGNIYGVPTKKEIGETWCLYADTEFMKEHGIDPANIKTLADAEVILEALAPEADRPGLTIQATSTNFANFNKLAYFDAVGTCSAAVTRRDEGNVVYNYYETEEFMEFCRLMHSWFEKGYIAEDILTRENYDEFEKPGVSYVSYAPLNEQTASANCGYDVTPMLLTPITVTNNSSTGSVYCILKKSKHPEEAMKFLAAWNTDPVIKNFITYGVEGRHYELVDGKVKQADNIWDLYIGQNWRTGNTLISYLQVYEPDNKNAEYEAFNEKAVASTVLGFQPDTAAIADKLTAIDGITAEYLGLLCCGVLDPEEYVPLMCEEMKAVGIDEVIAYYQAELDTWLATK